tara:strand:+ start:411 stop:1262 length:852 start_codon:yes stop_codon:yes gene_type:complete
MQLSSKKILSGLLMSVLVAPVFQAQAGIAGYWAPIFHEDFEERLPGPEAGDYAGLPINDAMRLRGDTWTSSLLTVPEHQCKPHPSTYGFRGIGNLRVQEEIDQSDQSLIALHTHIEWQAQKRTIWMDGRDHPDETAPHSWGGFSTGEIIGDTLVVHTTHLKAGWIRRNGMALSDQATLDEYFFLNNGGTLLTHVSIVTDPVYLTEPFVRTNGFEWLSVSQMGPYPCRPAIEIDRPVGEVPHWMIDSEESHAGSLEFSERWNIPLEAARGGAETALPEFIDVVR